MSFFRRLCNSFLRSKLEEEINEELKSHIEMRIADNLAAGMRPEEARRDALIRFGNRAVMKERVAAVDAEMALDSAARDVRYTLRQLRRSLTFTVTSVLTLALGIGANVVVFSVLNTLVLKLADVPDPSGLYNVVHRPHGYESQSYPDFLDYERLNSTMSGIAAYRFQDAAISTGKTTSKCWLYEVSGNYFDLVGARPALGRFFHQSDDRGPNSAPYVVLSENFWRSRFNADPGIIDTVVEINKRPFKIIGVAPNSFHGTDIFIWPDLWLPMVNEQQVEGFDFLPERLNRGIWLLGKLRPGVTKQQAEANLNAIAGQLARQYPATDEELSARLVKPGIFGDMLGDPVRTFLSAIMFLALLMLVAACANLASLFGARTADRSRELAIRLAIGCSRWHLLRQLLCEAVVISLIGGALGTFFAAFLLKMLTRWQPFAEFPVHVTVVPSVRVYAVALALALGSALLFALLPMRQAWDTNTSQVIKGGAGSLVFRRFKLRDGLLGVQIALCTLLVMASLVALRGMQRSLQAPIGFDPRGVILADSDLHMAGHSGEDSLALQKRMIEEVSRIPGVSSVGIIDELPLSTAANSSGVYRDGTTDLRQSNMALDARFFCVSPGYFQAAGTRLLAGRDFTWRDDTGSPKVALVNEHFARSMFPGASAIGHRFLMTDGSPFEIIGIVENGKYDSLTEDQQSAMFFPLPEGMRGDTSLIVRSGLPASEITPALEKTLIGIDPALPFNLRTWPAALGIVLFPARVATAALGVMGALAAMLAVTGVFGMAAYSISRRKKELGIRVALGAQPLKLMAAALGRPLVLLLSGSAAGLLLGVIASRLLAQVVYQATPRDPLVLAGVVATMTALGLLAVVIPAQRVMRIHPAGLLREE
jgi:predicted permease